MKNTLAAIFCWLAFTGAFAQCTVKVDDFTKDTIVSGREQQIGVIQAGLAPPLYISAQVEKTGSGFRLFLTPQFDFLHTFHPGDMVSLLFEDKSVLNLRVEAKDRSIRSAGMPFVQGSDNKIYVNLLMFDLTDADVDMLSAHKVVKIRCSENDYKLKGKKQSEIQSQINCILHT